MSNALDKIYGFCTIELMDIQEILFQLNPWWSGTFKSDFYRRDFYLKKIQELLSLPHIVVVAGARRAGKTTLMKLAIKELIEQGKNPKDIFYFSLDDPLLLVEAGKEKFLETILHQYEIIRGKPLDVNAIIFIDEIQSIDNWPLWLKRYYDQDKVKFVVSGSTASLIRGKHTELTGRSLNLEIYPFDFRELCALRLNIQGAALKDFSFESFQTLKNDTASKAKEIKILFEQYIEQGGYPEASIESDSQKQKIILTNYYNQILYRDVVKTFKIKETIILENLAVYLLQNIAQKFSFRNIAKTLDTNVQTVIAFIGYLATSYLFNVLQFYGTSLKTTLKKDKKFYCLDNGLRNAVVGHKDLDKGFLVENIVFNHLRQHFEKIGFWHNTKQQELDFVAKRNGQVLSIEVKYSDQKLVPDNFGGLFDFLETKRGQGSLALILTADTLKQEMVNGKRIIFVPVWLFCLAIV